MVATAMSEKRSLGPAPLGGPLGLGPVGGGPRAGSIWGYGTGGYGTDAYGDGGEPQLELMLQTVVTLGEKTREGHIIEAVTIPWFQIVTAIVRDPRVMQELDARRWEEMLAGAYKAAGYRVTLTPRSGDKGVDVIATKDDVVSIRIIDQMKAYAPGNLVEHSDLRDLLGALAIHPAASTAIITTTSDFAPSVYSDPELQRLMPTRVDLRPGPKLIEWMDQIRNRRERD
jgi:restriction system protein